VDVRAPRMCSMEAIMKSGVENSKQIRRVGAEFFDRDPRRVSRDLLGKLLVRRQAPIKAVLLDQTLFAGVGNWIADEVLFQASLPAARRGTTYCSDLPGTHMCTLFTAITIA